MTISPFAIEGLYFSYPNFPVFADFHISSQSRVTVLRGPSGCGKTTLLKLVSGLLTPASVVRFDVPSQSCFVVQEDSLLPWLSGIDNLRDFIKISTEQIISHPMFKLVEPFINKKTYTMSYGQRRSIEIFRAVLYRPNFLCLDEPLNFLDPVRRKSVVEFLKAPDLENTRIILSTHHGDDLLELDAETYHFDGNFPVSRLERE
jgi:ABC-type multidrug transport system ATPase subunit